jgi:hypothetical protein
VIAEILVAHLIGDYLLQSHWMATEKTKRWWPAIAHGLVYTLPFLFITQSPAALAVIAGTHIVIDHYRLARHLVWFKNLLGPRPLLRWEFYWEDGTVGVWDGSVRRYDGTDRMGLRPIHQGMSVPPPGARPIYGKRPSWEECSETGFSQDTPPWLAMWLMIIVDNTVHVLINIASITYL